jgi:tRNA(adenine34) deaminase
MRDENIHLFSDEFWMRQAIEEARACLSTHPSSLIPYPCEDVPIGAICVFENRVIGRGYNRREGKNDPTAHAEVLALRQAAQTLQSWRLDNVTLYVTLEPCPMCAGALWLARLARLVFGAWDEKAGACGSLFDIPRDPRLNHRMQVKGGVLEAQCAALLQEFFSARRAR